MSWVFFRILLPALAPAFVLAICILPFRKRLLPEVQALVRPVALVKDGQLAWLGVAMCAGALWEMQAEKARGHGLGEHLDVVGLAGFVLLLILNSSLVVGGSLFPTELPRPVSKGLYEHYAVLCWSVAAFAASGIGFVFVHVELGA